MLSLGVRAGVEVLRTTDMRADLFAAAYLPVMPSTDGLGVIDGSVPALPFGVGVAF